MSSTLRLTLTDELRAFVDSNVGDGTLYESPDEYIRDLLRQKKSEADAIRLRESIVAGYEDAIAGRLYPFNGDLQTLLERST